MEKVIELKSKKIIHILLAMLLGLMLTTQLVCAENATATPVKNQFITIDPIGNHVIGEIFFINGTTNLPVTEKLNGYIWTSIFIPAGKSGQFYPNAILPDISIVPMFSGTNRWSVNVTDFAINDLQSGWSPYFVTVQSKGDPSISADQKFILIPVINATHTTVLQTTRQNLSPTTTAKIVPPMTQSSSLPLVLPFVGILAIMILRFFLANKRD